MPRVIVLNGPPGSGKSTVARRYADEHPPALNLDIDRIRALVGGWRDDPGRAGRLARAIALAAARTHLAAGHDVVIPQFLARPEFLGQVERLAEESGAELHEIVLLDGKESTVRRFAERTRGSADPVHADAAELLERAGGLGALPGMYDELLALAATRPAATVVRVHGGVNETYRDVLRAIGER